MRRMSRAFLASAVAAVVLVFVAHVVLAQTNPAQSAPEKARHEAMEAVGKAMRTLGGMAKGQIAFDPKVVQEQGKVISDRLAESAKLFPPGSDKGETHAKPEVWSDRPGFDAAMKEGQEAAAALQSVQDQAGFLPALGTLGKSCQACHDKYRVPEQR